MEALGIIGIIVALIAIIVLVYKGVNIIVASFICTFIVMLTNAMPLAATFQDAYLTGVSGLIKNLFGITAAGTIIGEIYMRSGAAKSLARGVLALVRGKTRSREGLFGAIAALFVVGFLLAYGGVQVVALSLILIPLCLEVFREMDIPVCLLPGLIMGSTGTAAICGPGSPQMQNSIPQNILGTSSVAGLVPGIVAGVIVLAIDLWYIWFSAKRLKKADLHFVPLPAHLMPAEDPNEKLPNVIVSLIPLIAVFVAYNFFKVYIVFALFIGIVLAMILFYGNLGKLSGVVDTIGKGAVKCGFVTLAAASMGGFATTVSNTSGFGKLVESMVNSSANPNILAMIAVMAVVAFSGAGPTALSIAVPMFKGVFASMGMSMSALHRIASFSSVTFDSLPTNPVFVAITNYTGLTAKNSYKYVGVTTVLVTILGNIIVAVMFMLFPGMG